jgi:hypothetical protein
MSYGAIKLTHPFEGCTCLTGRAQGRALTGIVDSLYYRLAVWQSHQWFICQTHH